MINILYIAIAAFAGGAFAALLGWAQQGGPWDNKKALASLLRSLIGAIGIAVAMDYTGAGAPLIYFMAILSGAGFEVGGNRVAGVIAKKK